jgi:hypothetical protein
MPVLWQPAGARARPFLHHVWPPFVLSNARVHHGHDHGHDSIRDWSDRHMDEPVSTSQLLGEVRQARAEWEALLAQIGDAQMVRVDPHDGWSVKDMIAHITWYEREMINMVQAHALKGSELWNMPLAERNNVINEQNKDRPLGEVRAEAQQVYQSLLQGLESLSDEDLRDPRRFPGMPEDWKPWKVIAENTYEHYREHIDQVRMWLAK